MKNDTGALAAKAYKDGLSEFKSRMRQRFQDAEKERHIDMGIDPMRATLIVDANYE